MTDCERMGHASGIGHTLPDGTTGKICLECGHFTPDSPQEMAYRAMLRDLHIAYEARRNRNAIATPDMGRTL